MAIMTSPVARPIRQRDTPDRTARTDGAPNPADASTTIRKNCQLLADRELADQPIAAPVTAPDRRLSQSEKPAPIYTVAAVDRALDLIELLARVAPISLARIAGEAECTRTAAFRLLRTLQARGYALQDGKRGLWRLGGRMVHLAEAADTQGTLAAAAAPILDALSHTTGEVVYLSQRAGLEHCFVAVHASNPAFPRYAAVGSRGPLHAGIGRLLLAYAPDSTQSQVLSQRLPRYTPATIVDPHRIAAELPRIRARGWLMPENDVEPGAMSFVAPVRDAQRQVIAAVAVGGPTFRLKKINAAKVLDPLCQAAIAISRSLGWSGDTPAH